MKFLKLVFLNLWIILSLNFIIASTYNNCDVYGNCFSSTNTNSLTITQINQSINGSYWQVGSNQNVEGGTKTGTFNLITEGYSILDLGILDRSLNTTINGRNLYYKDNSISIDFQNGNIYDASAKQSIDYRNRQLRDSSAIMAIDWKNRLLKDNLSNNIFDWNNQIFYRNLTIPNFCYSNGINCTAKTDYTNLAFTNQSNSLTGNQIITGGYLQTDTGIGIGVAPISAYAINMYRNTNGQFSLNLQNANAGASAYSSYLQTNNVGKFFEMAMLSSGFGSGLSNAELINTDVTGGLKFVNQNGNISFSAGTWGTPPQIEINNNGNAYLRTTIVGGNLNITGNLSVKRPYAVFTDNTTQTMLSISAGQPINFSTIEDNYYINMEAKQNISVLQTGDYLFEISALGQCANNNKHINIWWQKSTNGGTFVNVARSNTLVELPTANVEVDIVVPFIIDLLTADKLRIMWNSDSTGCQLIYYTNTSFIPETPSVILTITKISEVT